MIYAQPGSDNAVITFKSHYDNFIGGQWVKPVSGEYFGNISPVNGQVYCQVARSTQADIDLALDAAHKAREAWAKTSVTERSNLLLKIADRIEANIEQLAVAECRENGKPVRETQRPTSLWWLTTSGILQAVFVLKKAAPLSSIAIRPVTISLSQSE